MHVSVDADLCQGHGVCESEAPDVFELGKGHKVTVLVHHPSEGQRRAVEEAVRFCPTHALSVVDG